MKRLCVIMILFLAVSTVFLATDAWAQKKFAWCWNRDVDWLDSFFQAQCLFPPIHSPCAVPCRRPGIQGQSVPCAFNTACPSRKLPCQGLSYGGNPYPLFR